MYYCTAEVWCTQTTTKGKIPLSVGNPIVISQYYIIALPAARDLKILINLETSETVYGIISEGVTSINLPYC